MKQLKPSTQILKAFVEAIGTEPKITIPDFDAIEEYFSKLIDDLKVATDVRQWLLRKNILKPDHYQPSNSQESTASIANKDEGEDEDDDRNDCLLIVHTTAYDPAEWHTMTAEALERKLKNLKASLRLPPQFYILWQKRSALFSECLRQIESEEKVNQQNRAYSLFLLLHVNYILTCYCSSPLLHIK